MPFLIALFLTFFIVMGITEVSLPLLWGYYVFDLVFG